MELENAVNFESNSKIAIVLTEEELEKFCSRHSELVLESEMLNQVQHDNDVQTLYLGHDVLLGKEQKELFKRCGITVKIIPQYYYPELIG